MKDLFIGIGLPGNQMIGYIRERIPESEAVFADFQEGKIDQYILDSERVFLFIGLGGDHTQEAVNLAETIKGLEKILVAIGSLPLAWEGERRNTRALERKDKVMGIGDYSLFPDNEKLYHTIPKYLPASYLFIPALDEILEFMKKLILR
jgi:cell division GTPase FtsZ